MAHDVFISYSSQDRRVADTVCARLEAAGIWCWMAPRDILPGATWADAIAEAIDDCRVFVVILSKASNEASNVFREIVHAADSVIPIVTFRIHDVEPSRRMGYYLKPTHWLDAIEPPLSTHVRDLTQSVEAVLKRNPGWSPKVSAQPKTKEGRVEIPTEQSSREGVATTEAMATGWFYVARGAPDQRVGPLAWKELYAAGSSGALQSDDLVWHSTLREWLPAGLVAGLQTTPPNGAVRKKPYQPSPFSVRSRVILGVGGVAVAAVVAVGLLFGMPDGTGSTSTTLAAVTSTSSIAAASSTSSTAATTTTTLHPLMKPEQGTISAGYSLTAGLRADGTVVAVGYDNQGQCDVSALHDLVAISAGSVRVVGVRADGTASSAGTEQYGFADISSWRDLVAVSAGTAHVVGLRGDGTAVALGNNPYSAYTLWLGNAYYGPCDVSLWKDLVAVSAGGSHTVGLRKDGTAVAVGDNQYGQCSVWSWKDLVAVSAGSVHTVGLRGDGTVVAVGDNRYGQCEVSSWSDLVAVSAGTFFTVGLRADGTALAVGDNREGQCKVSSWKGLVAISAGYTHTVGLRSDGTVVAVGGNDWGECEVSDWLLAVPLSSWFARDSGAVAWLRP